MLLGNTVGLRSLPAVPSTCNQRRVMFESFVGGKLTNWKRVNGRAMACDGAGLPRFNQSLNCSSEWTLAFGDESYHPIMFIRVVKN
jgi:hypothetical protein